MSSLLEEAIVDAKALKEAALKNAENAVLEKYSTEVKGALTRLLEQDDLGLGLEEESAPEADTGFLDDVPYAFQNEAIDAPGEDELIEIDFDALKTRIAEEAAEGIEPSPEELASSEEVAMELQESGLTQIQSKGSAGEDEASVGKSPVDAAAIQAGDEAMDELEEGEDEDEDIALSEEMLSDLIEELVVDMVPRPQGWSSVNSADNSVEQANNDAMGAAQGAHLQEEEDEEQEESTIAVSSRVPDVTLYETQISELKESEKELLALLVESKNQLKKLNLENAKLVYQNKALNSASLNERQKTKIVEAVQSANSVEEANMIYETVQNAVGLVSSNNSSRPQTLREAVQRPPSLLLNSKKNNEATGDPKMGRMLRLAGLTK